MADGRRRLVWTTFMPSQVDLDVANDRARAYLRRILAALRAGGVTTVRLDAVGYAVKTPGTDSFMTPETLDFVREIVAIARAEDLRVLVEVHAHYSQQLAIAPLVDDVYDFALAPLLLHSLGTGTSDRLAEWLRIRPRNAITVLDTHDGIGVIDAGPSGDRPGLIDQDEMAAIFERAAVATDGHSTVASVIPAWMSLPHQINATFFSALGADATSYILARAVQLWLPGRPQLYSVGLLGGLDDVALFQRTGQGRDVNRHVYTPDELEAALASEVTRAQLALVRLRSTHPAFGGEFGYGVEADGALHLHWTLGDERAELAVSFAPAPAFRLRLTGADGTVSAEDVAALAAL
jgi:sucrose phosphorylase